MSAEGGAKRYRSDRVITTTASTIASICVGDLSNQIEAHRLGIQRDVINHVYDPFLVRIIAIMLAIFPFYREHVPFAADADAAVAVVDQLLAVAVVAAAEIESVLMSTPSHDTVPYLNGMVWYGRGL